MSAQSDLTPAAIEKLASQKGFLEPDGTILLKGERDKRGRVHGLLYYGERGVTHTCEVDVDLSRLDMAEAVLRSRKHRDYYILTERFYEATQYLLGYLLDTQSDHTLRNLQRILGDEDCDRFLELMEVNTPQPSPDVVEKVVPVPRRKRVKR